MHHAGSGNSLAPNSLATSQLPLPTRAHVIAASHVPKRRPALWGRWTLSIREGLGAAEVSEEVADLLIVQLID